jgi:hypothetical protein
VTFTTGATVVPALEVAANAPEDVSPIELVAERGSPGSGALERDWGETSELDACGWQSCRTRVSGFSLTFSRFA